MRAISLQIPEGAEPGDSLSFSVDGQDLEIPIPVGSQAGEILEIQVGGEDDGGNNGHEDNDVHETAEPNIDGKGTGKTSLDSSPWTVVKIPYVSGVIELVSGTDTSTSTKVTDTIDYGDDKATKSDDNNYYRIDDGTYVHPWPSGTAMADFLRNEDSNDWLKRLFSKTSSPSAAAASTIDSSTTTDGISVLELGSGMGMAGLAFAANYITKSESLCLPALRKMVLSDVDAGLSLLRTNIERNRDIFGKDSSTVTAQALQWSTDSSSDKAEKFDVILASDVLYNSECIPALVATIKRHLNTNQPSSSVLVAVRWRKPDLERQFFEELEGWNNKTWGRVHTMNCPLSWMEYGLPTSDVSNKYFHQTMVSVNGNPKSLAEILDAENPSTGNNDTTNDDAATKIPKSLMDGMNDEEAEVFESFFIQIYCLCDKDIENPADSNKRSHEEGNNNDNGTKKKCKD